MTEAPMLPDLPDPILVVGGYGYRNVGDEAILASLLRTLHGRRVSVVSRLPAETSAAHGVRAVQIASAVSELARHRSVLIGGGGLFGADMGLTGRFLPAFGLAAAALGRRVALHGIGVDPGLPAVTAVALRQLARRATQIQVRDRRSAALLRAWGVEAAVGPDLSAWLPAASSAVGTAALRGAGLDPRQPIVGLSLTAVNGAVARAAVDAVAETMDAMPEVQFCFIPMSQHPFVADHNDLVLARRLSARQPRLRILEGMLAPATVMAVYSHLSAVVGMRYHSLLFATRAGVPLLPIVYADKCRTWLAEHGQDPVEPAAPALIERLTAAIAARSAPRVRRAAS
jgi:L-malate glycosyltransferase